METLTEFSYSRAFENGRRTTHATKSTLPQFRDTPHVLALIVLARL